MCATHTKIALIGYCKSTQQHMCVGLAQYAAARLMSINVMKITNNLIASNLKIAFAIEAKRTGSMGEGKSIIYRGSDTK